MAVYVGLARIGRDAELRYTPSNDAVTNLPLAFSYGKKGDNGYKPTTWVDASLWGKLAEAIVPYLTKGSQVHVVIDDLHIETYKGRDGTPASKLAGRVSSIELCGGGRESNAAAPAPAPRAPAPRPAQSAAPRPSTSFDDMDDDIPFVVNELVFQVTPGKQRRLARASYK